ncbi:hypothetical protein GbCGDNIH6_8268 [Granulibacter bethesdensis]|uniref:hypothetical protein n=1 Tax=Granulibacter bethesdensis TaxID=364410 RepID=UPI0009094586|nr:hypothetical protein [Granulibacter bethesdensis]APH57347.1 hypothetical protein GbCGDNIH6_8268 [Granulibacter bethesdensis]
MLAALIEQYEAKAWSVEPPPDPVNTLRKRIKEAAYCARALLGKNKGIRLLKASYRRCYW